MLEALTSLGEATWDSAKPIWLELLGLAVLALLLERLLRPRAKPGARVLVCTLVLVRAAAPVHFDVAPAWTSWSDASVLDATDVASGETDAAVQDVKPAVLAVPATFPVAPRRIVVSAAPSPPAPAAAPSVRRSERSPSPVHRFAAEPRLGARPAPGRANPEPLSSAGPEAPSVSVGAGLGAAWLLVALFLVLEALVSDLRLRRSLRRADPAGERVQELLRELAPRFESRTVHRVRAVLSDRAGSAAVHGFLRPRLLIDPSLERRSDPEIRAVLAHELSHIAALDTLWLLPLALLRRIWWPQPLVHLVAKRLITAVEEQRDADALRVLELSMQSPEPRVHAHGAPLAGAPTPATQPSVRSLYARLLVDLADTAGPNGAQGTARPRSVAGLLPFLDRGRRDLERRITMILKPHRSRTSLAVLCCTVAGLGSALALTEASPMDDPIPRETTPTVQEPIEEEPIVEERSEQGPFADEASAAIRFERTDPLPSGYVELQQKLDRPLAPFEWKSTRTEDFVAWLAEEAAFEARLLPPESGVPPLPDVQGLRGLSVRDALDLVARLHDWSWSIADGVVHLGERARLPIEVNLQIYDLRQAALGHTKAPVLMDEESLLLLCQDSSPDPWLWDLDGVDYRNLGNLVAVTATEAMHQDLQRMLARLCAGEKRLRGNGIGKPWHGQLLEALDAPCPEVRGADLSRGEVFAAIAAVSELPLLLDPRTNHDWAQLPIESDGHSTPFHPGRTVGDALRGLAGSEFIRPSVEHGAILFTEEPAVELWAYPHAAGVLEQTLHDSGVVSEIEELIVMSIDPASWDSSIRFMARVNDEIALVGQTPRNQARVASLLTGIERAFQGK